MNMAENYHLFLLIVSGSKDHMYSCNMLWLKIKNRVGLIQLFNFKYSYISKVYLFSKSEDGRDFIFYQSASYPWKQLLSKCKLQIRISLLTLKYCGEKPVMFEFSWNWRSHSSITFSFFGHGWIRTLFLVIFKLELCNRNEHNILTLVSIAITSKRFFPILRCL